MFLVDLNNKKISGKEAERRLGEVGITVNKNFIPFDERNAYETSGIRIGTPGVTTRGMMEREMALITGWIDLVLTSKGDGAVKAKVRKEVAELCAAFPLYPGLEF
jgi:glycine hydroxymethyltransferase